MTNKQNALTARQAQRMLHFVGRLRAVLSQRINMRAGSAVETTEDRRELAVVDALIVEVTPIIWPKPVVPPGLQDRNGDTR